MSVETSALRPATVRRVGPLLQTGIIFFPYVFVWLLLRQGYSTRARIIGFAWMLWIAVVALGEYGIPFLHVPPLAPKLFADHGS